MAKDRENNSHYLYQLVGAPIMSMVQAEAQAMQATMDYIEKLGFEKNEDEEDNGNNFGNLRQITFSYEKMTQGGIQKIKVKVPMLSLIPIPMLSIKEADLEMFIKVVDVHLESSGKSSAIFNSKGNDRLGFLSSDQLQIKTALGSHQTGKSTSNPSSEFQLKLNVKMEQSQFPDGIQKLLNLMSSGFIEEPEK